jgi:AbrB family looped-hinge helix DNA binding protein
MPRARITSKGQITIPKEIRDLMGVGQGDSVDFVANNGHVELYPIKKRSVAEFRGLFKVERALPFEEERARAWDARAREILGDDESADA